MRLLFLSSSIWLARLFVSRWQRIRRRRLAIKIITTYQVLFILVAICIQHEWGYLERDSIPNELVRIIDCSCCIAPLGRNLNHALSQVRAPKEVQQLAPYLSKRRVFKKPKISSNLSLSKRSSFFLRSIMLKPKIASIPLAKQLSYIRKTMFKGNLMVILNCQ